MRERALQLGPTCGGRLDDEREVIVNDQWDGLPPTEVQRGQPFSLKA